MKGLLLPGQEVSRYAALALSLFPPEKPAVYHAGCAQQLELVWVATACMKTGVQYLQQQVDSTVHRCAVPKHTPCTGYSVLHRVHPNNPPRYIDICTCSVGRPPPIATAALASPLHLTRGVGGRRKLGQRDATVLDELQRCRGHALCTVRLHSASNDAQSGTLHSLV